MLYIFFLIHIYWVLVSWKNENISGKIMEFNFGIWLETLIYLVLSFSITFYYQSLKKLQCRHPDLSHHYVQHTSCLVSTHTATIPCIQHPSFREHLHVSKPGSLQPKLNKERIHYYIKVWSQLRYWSIYLRGMLELIRSTGHTGFMGY